MTPTKLLIGQIVLVFAIVIGAVWIATQWAAGQLGYQPRLGPPGSSLAAYPVYHPWRLFEWWYVYEAYAPRVFNRAGAIAGAQRHPRVRRRHRRVALAGAAEPAGHHLRLGALGDHDGDRAGPACSAPPAFFSAATEGDYLRHDGPEHVMAFAPTRSGKGVGLVVPTLLSAGPAPPSSTTSRARTGSSTAGWRSRFSHCLLFNPTDPRSAAYNPLLEVRKGAHEVRDVQNIADILVDPEGALRAAQPLGEDRARAAGRRHPPRALRRARKRRCARVATFLSDPARSFERTLRRDDDDQSSRHGCDAAVHPVVASAAREVLNKTRQRALGRAVDRHVVSSGSTAIRRSPTTTSRCDWRIADLMDAERPVSLYLVVPPSDISRTKPLIRLILNQIGRRLTETLDGSDGDRAHATSCC